MKNGIELELEKKLIDEIAEEKKFISFRKLVKIFELNAQRLSRFSRRKRHLRMI